jgi:hypothetical protein
MQQLLQAKKPMTRSFSKGGDDVTYWLIKSIHLKNSVARTITPSLNPVLKIRLALIFSRSILNQECPDKFKEGK